MTQYFLIRTNGTSIFSEDFSSEVIATSEQVSDLKRIAQVGDLIQTEDMSFHLEVSQEDIEDRG